MDPLKRDLFIDLELEEVLRGEIGDAIDRFLRRLLEPDYQPLLPAIRHALQQAGDGAVDQMIFEETLREQHRDVLFPHWSRPEGAIYPILDNGPTVPYEDDFWSIMEGQPMHFVLRRLARLGLIRVAEGVFAPTEDGKLWAGSLTRPRPPIWVTEDLEITVPPGAIPPGERFILEQVGRCVQRDVVDRIRLERDGVRQWLTTHSVDTLLERLAHRCAALPPGVVQTLTLWQAEAERIVLVRG